MYPKEVFIRILLGFQIIVFCLKHSACYKVSIKLHALRFAREIQAFKTMKSIYDLIVLKLCLRCLKVF